METDRSDFCGCKGIRTCLLCEKKFGLKEKTFDFKEVAESLSYCYKCGLCHPGHNKTGNLDEIPCTGDGVFIPGIYVKADFLSTEEEENLVNSLDTIPWTLSQSGRRKQNFGPKCNFKKRKLKLGDFNGFPICSKFIHDKFKDIDLIRDYRTVEQCTLEYNPENGALIEPHIDDCWIWGERIITVNLLSDSVLSLIPYTGSDTKYNLDCVDKYSCSVQYALLRIPMPRRSLLVMYGEVRYAWQHMIFRSDIKQRRICLAFREFTKPYLEGGQCFDRSKHVFEMAKTFF